MSSEASQLRFLHSWWSRTYNRPLKDPLLQQYTLEELYYEFKDRTEREKARLEQAEEQADKIEEAKQEETDAWIAAEEAKQEETDAWIAAEEAKESNSNPPNWKPTEGDQKWMEEELERAKIEHGESFGEDIDEDFG